MILIKETGTGVPGANTYASIEDGDKFLPYSDKWLSTPTATRARALSTASLIIDNNIAFYGRKREDSFLEFPRTGLFNYYTRESIVDRVPTDIVRATCDLANTLLDRDVIQDSEDATLIRRIQVTGMMEVEMSANGSIGNRAYPITRQALRLLGPYGVLKSCRI